MNPRKIFRLLMGIFLGCSLLVFPQAALADQLVLFSGVTGPGTYGCNAVGTPLAPCELNGFYKVSVQFTCTSGPCVDEIQLQQRNSSSDAWATVLDLFNTGANDLGYSNVGFGQVQVVVVSVSSGTLQGTMNRLK